MSTELRRIDGKPVLRFERVLAHPPAKVWRAVTEPDGCAGSSGTTRTRARRWS
jgi:uncharacterized protein YndB with AHSA1/START domain